MELSEGELKILAKIPIFLPHVRQVRQEKQASQNVNQMQQEEQGSQKTCLSIVVDCLYSFFVDTNSQSKDSNSNASNAKANSSSIGYHSHQE